MNDTKLELKLLVDICEQELENTNIKLFGEYRQPLRLFCKDLNEDTSPFAYNTTLENVVSRFNSISGIDSTIAKAVLNFTIAYIDAANYSGAAYDTISNFIELLCIDKYIE